MKNPRVIRAMLIAAAACCGLAALLLAVLAIDVVRSHEAVAAGDRRYASSPQDDRLWRPGSPGGSALSTGLLGVDDDLAFRDAVRAARLSQRDRPTDSSPATTLRRAKAQKLLQQVARDDSDPRRRSRAWNLLSVLLLSTPAADREERATVQRIAQAGFQKAIETDPANDEAKYNLEVLLRRRAGVQTVQGGPTPNPSRGQGQSRGAATGQPGRGY